MLETKQTLNDQIIQSENWITELSSAELEELFRRVFFLLEPFDERIAFLLGQASV